jgi:hypothetical protein
VKVLIIAKPKGTIQKVVIYDKQSSFFYANNNINQKYNTPIIQSYERVVQLHHCEMRCGLETNLSFYYETGSVTKD